MQENFHKARTLLSSRMDDVRALKRMVSETKETLELKRRQKLLEEINARAAARAAQEMYEETFRNQEAQAVNKQRVGTANSQQRQKFYLNGPQKIQLNHPTHAKPIVSYAGLIAQKY